MGNGAPGRERRRRERAVAVTFEEEHVLTGATAATSATTAGLAKNGSQGAATARPVDGEPSSTASANIAEMKNRVRIGPPPGGRGARGRPGWSGEWAKTVAEIIAYG